MLKIRKKLNIAYFHGGPGLNSNPEFQILREELSSKNYNFYFWNEPSAQRGNCSYEFSDNAFENITLSMEDFLNALIPEQTLIIGHSFAAQSLLKMLSTTKNNFLGLILITPGLDIYSADLNIFSTAYKDFKILNQEDKSSLMRNILSSPHFESPENIINGYLLSLKDPHLFNSYFVNQDIKDAFLSKLVGPYEMDVDSFQKIRTDFSPFIATSVINIPTCIIFAKNDFITPMNENITLAKNIFSHLQVVEYSNAGHFPHLEDSARFFNDIDRFVTLLRNEETLTQIDYFSKKHGVQPDAKELS